MTAKQPTRSELDLIGWRSLPPPEAIRQLLEHVLVQSGRAEQWYERHQARASNWSKCIRAIAIILGGLGGLCPVIAGIRLSSVSTELTNAVGQFGYVFLGLAASLIAFDHYFGISSEWMRCTAAVIEIRRLQSELEFDWAALILKLPESPTATDMPPFLARARDASVAFNEVVASETEAWRRHFEKSFDDIEAVLKVDQMKLGSERSDSRSERAESPGKPTNGRARRR